MEPVTTAAIIGITKEIADEVYEKTREGQKAGYTDEDAAVATRKRLEAERLLRRSGDLSFLIIGKTNVGKTEWLERMQGRPPRPESAQAPTENIVEMIAVFPYSQDRIVVKQMPDVPGEKQDDWLNTFIHLKPDGIIFMVDYPSVHDYKTHEDALNFLINNILNYQSKWGVLKGLVDPHYRALQNLKVLSFVVNRRDDASHHGIPDDILSHFYGDLRELEQSLLRINHNNDYFEYCINAINDDLEQILDFNLRFFQTMVSSES